MSKASQLRQKAQTFLKKGKVEKAIEEYKKLLTIESRNPNLYNELGDIYLRANDRVQAVASFEKASAKYENVALYNNAVAVCKKILRIVPKRNETIYKLGEIKAKQKLLGEAESFFSQFFDSILAEPDSDSNGVKERIENVLELIPDCEGIWSMASDVFSHVGEKARAAEVLAHLIAKNSLSGDPQRLNFYRSRLDLLKQALNRADLEKLEKISADAKSPGVVQSGGPEAGASGADEGSVDVKDGSVASGDPDPGIAVAEDQESEPPAGVDDAGISLTDYASDLGGEEAEKVVVEETVIQEEPGSVEEPDVSVETTLEPESEEGPGDSGSDQPEAVEEVDEAVEETAPHDDEKNESREYVIGGDEEDPPAAADSPAVVESEAEEVQTAADERSASVSEDLSDLIDEEDARIENESSSRNLAEEITSDVEEDDFRSHYDLGMAYIEMGLYADAVKELQISSRSDQLKLQSLEMVGMCFLSLDNPRLAVKQLERGLEIALTSGQDSLGIHYNLGLAYEALEDEAKAREHFEEVYIVDVTFRDITEKMKKFSTVS